MIFEIGCKMQAENILFLHTMINYSVESYGLFGDEREVGSFTSVGHKGVDGG